MAETQATALDEVPGAAIGAIEEFPAFMLQESAGEPEAPLADAGRELGMLATMLRGLNAIGLELAHLAQNSTENNANARSIAQAPERLFVSVFEISQSTGEAASEAAAADERAVAGLAAVRNAIAAMQKISCVRYGRLPAPTMARGKFGSGPGGDRSASRAGASACTRRAAGTGRRRRHRRTRSLFGLQPGK